MERFLYERPREKLRSQGVRALALTELVQLVIGSGNSQVSGARLARQVVEHLQGASFDYESLITIRGLGDAKVGQLLAALELGRRQYTEDSL